jgi:uncharacterized repeat protein (TIGR01451 family)
MNLISRLPKKVLFAIATVITLVGVTGAVNAWFPERPTYTIQNPAPHVTFNSITNNPNHGDERAFFEVKDAAHTQPNGFAHTINNLSDGQELLLRVYVHNNAADNLNGTNFNGAGVAKNTKVRIHLPTATAKSLRANAYISADNATPREIADNIDLMDESNFELEYIPGSARQYTNAVPSGIALSDTIVTTGAPIGYTQADGIVPGCFQYSSIVTVKVKVKATAYKVTKQVRFEGQGPADWKESIKAQPGQTVEWRVAFRNTGNTTVNNVKIVDNLPAGMTFVPGSVKLFNGNHPNGIAVSDAAVQANGRQVNADIGSYKPEAEGRLVFKTKVAAEKDIPCGGAKFNNIGYATPEGSGTVSDDALVTVDKVCAGQPNKPTTLPNTGAGDVFGIFAAVTVAGTAAHRLVLAKRY